ncbi:MAG: TIGR03936 family radical SAM-associated protein, partial [Pirellulales bacterium]|nr:TIGR03936 family radical SAM-associated protein [Pirellulales bacterium]
MFAVTETTNPSDQPAAAPTGPLRVRYRIRFSKTGLLRWISHRDLARLWERLVRRASLKLSMTEGFHPKPRIAFPSALALGVEGLAEVVELELAEELSPGELLRRLQSDHQPGLAIVRVSRLPDGFGKAQLSQSDYQITLVESADRQAVEQAIDRLMSQAAVSVQRKGKTLTVEVASQIPQISLAEDHLCLTLAASDGASLRPGDVLDLLGLADWIEQGATITRTNVSLHREFQSADPRWVAAALVL